MPFCNLPYIIDGKVKVTETLAVHQYIASKYKPELLGRTPQEKGRSYQLANVVIDKFIGSVVSTAFDPNGDKAKMNEKVLENLKPLVDYLGSKKFLEGDTVFLPDFLLFEFVEYAQAINDGVTFQTYPTL